MNETHWKILQVIFALFAVSGLFIISACILKRRLFSEVWCTYGIGFVIVGSLLTPVYIGGIVLLTMLLFLGCRCTYEMTKAIDPHQRFLPDTMVLSVVSITLAYLQNYQMMLGAFVLFILYAFVYFLFTNSLIDAIIRIVCACYPGLFFYHFAFIASSPDRFQHVVFLYAIIEMNDAGGYLIGKFLGKTKLWEAISPNKTWEGSIGGICFAILTGFALWFAVAEFKLWQLVTFVIAISIVGSLGDLVASKIKRTINIKDFNSIIASQGGVLDIFDSLIFSAPVFYYFMVITGIFP